MPRDEKLLCAALLLRSDEPPDLLRFLAWGAGIPGTAAQVGVWVCGGGGQCVCRGVCAGGLLVVVVGGLLQGALSVSSASPAAAAASIHFNFPSSKKQVPGLDGLKKAKQLVLAQLYALFKVGGYIIIVAYAARALTRTGVLDPHPPSS